MASNESTVRLEQPHLAQDLLRLERRVEGIAVGTDEATEPLPPPRR